MEQRAYLAMTAMLNAFPQTAGNADLTLRTFEAVLRDVSPQAVIEASERFTAGKVEGQNPTFAPSTAEFAREARRIADLIPYRNMPRLPARKDHSWSPQPKEARVRMGFKMAVLSAAIDTGTVDEVAKASARGLEDMVALGQRMGVPVPDELWKQIEGAA